jgi:Mce-associated membrane protein
VAGQRSRARGIPSTPAAPERKATRTPLRQRLGALKPSPGTQTVAEQAGRRRWVAPVTALVVALAVLGVLVGLSLRDPGAQQAAQRAAASQARTSVEQMLSYNYKTIDKQAAQIETLLTGSFRSEFTKAMDTDIKPLAVKNQTVVQARVSDVGVMSATPTTVKVLVFVNQAKVGADSKQPAVDQNRVIATMSKVGDRWLVSKVDAF